MKRFIHHAIAAVVGLVLAALMVFYVFGSADEQGSAVDGEAPDRGAEVAEEEQSECGTVAVGDGKAAVDGSPAVSADSLPAVVDDSSQEVRIDDPEQVAWLARLHADLSRCTDEIALRPNVDPKVLAVAATFPGSMNADTAGRHVVSGVATAFDSGPFQLATVTVDVAQDGSIRTLTVTRPVWTTFVRQRSNLGLEPSVAGLQALDQRIGYSRKEFDASGW